MNWTGDNTDGWTAICSDPESGYSIYCVDPNGELRIYGTNWKECPVPSGPCRKSSGGQFSPYADGTNGKCRQCSYSPVKLRGEPIERSKRVAELIQRNMEDCYVGCNSVDTSRAGS